MNSADHRSRTVIEHNRRLSESLLWTLQQNFYTTNGLRSWRNGAVPHYVTSNPTIADAYARVVLGYWRDWLGDAPARNAPFYLLELGAGSGRFGFLFLKRLQTLRQRYGLQDVPFVYVMSDFSPSVIDAWQRHPALLPFVDAGLLDFALFNPVHDTALALINRGTVLCEGALTRPLVVLANYFFDSLPQDLFGVEAGRLYEITVTGSTAEAEPDLSDPELLSRLHYTYGYRAIEEAYYTDAGFERVLQGYRTQLQHGVVRFPIGALRCCRTLHALSKGQIMLLSGDRGFVREETLQDQPMEALFTPHAGAFSMPVNYHAVGAYFRALGGRVLQPPHEDTSLCVAAFLAGRPPQGTAHAAQAFADAIAEFGPDDFFVMTRGIQQYYDILSLPEIIALLRFSRGDTFVLQRCLPTLKDLVAEATPVQKEALQRELARAWALYYHLDDTYNLPLQLGLLLHKIGNYAEALFYYQQARSFYGEDLETLYNIACCHYELGQWTAAFQALAQAPSLEPERPPLLYRHTERRINALRAAILEKLEK